MLPDYALVCISAMAGVTEVLRQHMAVALALEIPMIFLLTKIDMTTPEALRHLLTSLQERLQVTTPQENQRRCRGRTEGDRVRCGGGRSC